MNQDLERLIALQRLDSAVQLAERRVAEDPDRQRAFDARLDEARAHVTTAKERLGESQAARRAIEKDVAVQQARLSKFREQGMSVKTNQEFHAIQHEISFAENEIKGLEDKILENMMEGDELTGAVKRADALLAAEQKAVDAERKTLGAEVAAFTASLDQTKQERADLAKTIDGRVLALFQMVSNKRNGIGLSEAKDGVCAICHVRLRPQVFNTIRRNDEILQCDHCNRILYFVPVPVAPAAPADTAPVS